MWLAGWWPEQKVESVQEMRERVVAKLRKVIIGELVQLRKLRKVQERGREGFRLPGWRTRSNWLARYHLALPLTTYLSLTLQQTSLDWCLTLTLQFHRLELSNVNSALQPLPQASQYGKKLYLKTVKKNHLYNIVSSWYSSTALTPRCFGERCFTACLYLTDKICQAFYFPRQWLLKSMQPGLTNTLFLTFSFETQKHSHLVSKCWM